MNKVNWPTHVLCQMRKLLTQKESNYLRMKRQKMNASMFKKIKTIGVGAFGEVTLVKKVQNLFFFLSCETFVLRIYCIMTMKHYFVRLIQKRCTL